MNDFAFQVLIIALSLGFISYLLCWYLAKNEGDIGLSSFLLMGNSVRDAAISIVGTIFSGSILFIGMVHFYRIFSWILFPFYIMAIFIGFYFLIKKIYSVFGGKESQKKLTVSLILNRFENLSQATGCRWAFYSVLLIYLFTSLTTEMSVLKSSIEFFSESQSSALVVLALVSMTYAYVYLGGFKGVLLTDVLQTATIVISFLILIFLIVTMPNHSRGFSFPKPTNIEVIDYVCMCFSTLVIGSAILSSTPEIWIRINTLKKINDSKIAIKKAIIGLLLVLSLPILLIGVSNSDSAQGVKLTEAYAVWSNIISQESQRILTFPFLVILVTAIFTTIDTFILSFEQFLYILRNEYELVNDNLRGRLRNYTPFFVITSFALACRLNENIVFLIGAMSISIPIVLFFMIHLAYRFKVGNIPFWIYWIPIVAGILIMPKTYSAILKEKPHYYLIPITVFSIQCLLFFGHVGLCQLLGKAGRESENNETK